MTSVVSDPLVSVVIPVYNGAEYLPRSVASVLAQTLSGHEVIVVDDASRDDPAAALRGLGPKVTLLRQETNRGPAAARNRGIAAAKGRFIAFLDADDWWLPQKLATQLRLFEADPTVEVVFSNFAGVQLSGEPGGWCGDLIEQLRERGTEPISVGASGFVFRQSLVSTLVRYTSFIHPSTVVIRRDVFDRVGLFDEELFGPEDLNMWIRLADRCRIGMVPETLAFTEMRPGSVGRQTRRMSEHMLKLYSELPTIVSGLDPEVLVHIRRFCASEHTGLGWHYRTDGNGPMARSHYWSSLRYEFKVVTLLRWLRAWLPDARQGTVRPIAGK